MADRDFQINVRIDGEAASFETALGDAERAVLDFKKEIGDMNRAILGATTNIRSVRDNARGLATDMGYAERALTSMTKRVREVRDDAIQLSGAMKFGAEAVSAMGVASDDLTNAQAELVATIDRVNKSLGDQLVKLEGTLLGADMLQSTMRDLALAEEEARIAADGEADAIDRVGDAAMATAEKIQLANGLSRDQLSLFDKLRATTKFEKQGSIDFMPVGAKPIGTVTPPAYNAAALRAEAEQLSLIGTEAMKAGTQLSFFDDKNRQIAYSAPAVDAMLANEARAINEVGDAADRAAAKLAVMKAASDMPSGDGGGSGFFAQPRGLLYHQGFGGRLPWWLGGAVLGTLGAGGLLPMAGLGPERLVTTPAAIAASAVPALGGAAAIGAGALGTLAVGGGSDMAVMKSTIADTKTLFTDYTNLTNAVKEYGKGSRQAAQAQAQLNLDLQNLGPASHNELALAKRVDALNTMWDKVTANARGAAVNILDQVVQLGHDYVGRVASAAFQNLTIINQDIKPLFSWLEGPQGIQIWNNLENKFKTDLPIAVHAFTMGLELLLRIVNISSQYVGGFLKSVNDHLTQWNSYSDFRLSHIIQGLVIDFRIWWNFIKAVGGAIYNLFHNAAGEGFAVLKLFTQWLDKFNAWAKSMQGQQWLHSFFAARKDELIALVKLVALFIAGWGKLYIAVQPLVPVFTGVLKILTDVFNVVNKLAPAFGTALAAYVMFGKYVGFGAVNSGLAKVAGVGGAGGAAVTAAEIGAGGAAAKSFFSVAGKVPAAAETSGIASLAAINGIEGGVGGAVAGLASKMPSLIAKLGPIAKTAAMFYIGTGIITGISQGVQTHGDIWTKVGASITNSVHNLGPTVAPAAVFIGTKLISGIGGYLAGGAGALLTTFFSHVGDTNDLSSQSPKWLQNAATHWLKQLATDPSWSAFNLHIDEMKQRMGGLSPAAGKVFQDIINSMRKFQSEVGSLTAVTPAMAGKIIGSFQQIKTEGGSAIQNLYTTVHQNMDNIKTDIGTKSLQGKEALTLNFEAAARFMTQNYTAMGVSTSKAMGFIVSMLSKAASEGSGSFAGFINNLTDGEKRMLLNTEAGMKSLIQIVNDRLKAMHQTPISAGSVVTPGGQLLTYTPTHKVTANLVGNPSNISTGGFSAATGKLMTVGKPGDAGQDAIPMTVGGTNIMVGSGEQVAVFNRYQQAYVNSRLSDVGGLPGVFHKITTPHYMSTGGLLPTVQGKATTFGPPGEAAGSTAFPGHSSSEVGISLRIPGTHYDDPRNRALMGHYFNVTIPGQGHSAKLLDIDLGPADWTGADIDVTGAAFPALGIPYSPYWSAPMGTAVPVGGTSGVVGPGVGTGITPPKVKGGGALGELTQGTFNTIAKAASKYLMQIEAKIAAQAGPAVGGGIYTGSGKPFQAGRLTFPLPQGSWQAGALDQGWDISAAADTPEYAVAAGTISSHGIGGFGPWAPVLTLDHPYGPGMSAVYYGHAGPKYELSTGTHVSAGQVIGSVGPGIVGISTGPHLEIGWYPPGVASGASMKSALGYNLGGIMAAASGAYPKKSHTQVPKGRHSGSGKQSKIPTTSSRHPVTHLPHIKSIPGLPGLNPGFSYKYNSEAYIEPVIRGWPVHKPTHAEMLQSISGDALEGITGSNSHGRVDRGGNGVYNGAYFVRRPDLEQFSGGNAQALLHAQSFMGLLSNELSLIQDADPNTNAPLANHAYTYGADVFYPGDPANKKGYVGAWKIDQQIAGNLGILAMMQAQVGGSRSILKGSLPKYVKGTKHSLHKYLTRVIQDEDAIAKLQQQQRANRVTNNPVTKLDEQHRIHEEFTKARGKLHVKEIKGKYSASSAYFAAKGVLEQIRTDELTGLAAANILDPTAESIAYHGIQGAYSDELTRLNQLRTNLLEKEQVSWAKASTFLSLAEQDALYNINRRSSGLAHQDTVWQIAIDDIRPKMDDAKRKSAILARDLSSADARSMTGHMRKQLAQIGESSYATGFATDDIKHQIITAISTLEDPGTGIPQYKHFIIPQLEQQRNQITGSSAGNAADQTQELQLLQQLLTFRAADFAVAEQQLRALQGFTPVLGQMVGAFAGGTLKGRVVGETGYALVHRDETIAPDPEGPFGTQRHGGGHTGDVTVQPNIYITLSGGLQPLESFVDARIEKKAPSAVNKALGSRTRRIANAPGR